jgi:antitoxin (DNA-binding transcriptional repressor) of toxin-antitoxin stability system
VKKRLEMGLKIAYNRDSFGGDIMKLLSVRDLKTKSSQVWKDLPDQKEMVITSNGRPIAILSSVNENNLEQVLSAFRQARAIEAVTSIQYESVCKGKDKITLKEINNEIKIVRSQRKR